MFKKIFGIVVVFAVVLSLSACGKEGQTSLFSVEDLEYETVPNSEYVYYEGEDGKSVFELLIQVADITYDEVDGGGKYVTSIDGVQNDYNNTKYWVYFVDGEPMDRLPDQYATKEGQRVEWFYGVKL